jgi:tetratricopeptide (TPR) repeat protein
MKSKLETDIMKPFTTPSLSWQNSLAALCLGGLLLGGNPASLAQTGRPEAPLLEGLGDHHHQISTFSALAQRYFNQGMVQLYNFNHAEAIRSFKAVAELDPDCAMAWWGVAYAEGPNINAPMMPDAYPRAWQALQRAVELKPKAGERERAYIDALQTRYRQAPVEDRSELDLAFVDAMRKTAQNYPDDLDAQAIFCEAIMNTMPWNYWTPEKAPKELTKELLQTLQTVLRRNPDHPGANHFFIHAIEAGPSPEQGIPSADRLEKIAPAAGHLVHMASHIYVRVGQYDDAVLANERAIRADENYFRQCRAQGMYPAGYYPHNVHFLWYANSLRGNSAEAVKAAKKVADYALDLRCGAMEGPRQRYLHILALAQFGQWDQVLSEPRPADDYPFDQGMHHYARCIALLARKDLPAAREEYAAFKRANTEEAVQAVSSDFFPAHKVVEVADHILQGKLALSEGKDQIALTHLSRAVEVEDDIAYMEPPFWYYSARWSLGAAQIMTGRYEEAEAVFRKDLEWLPRNGWALNGLAAALRKQGKSNAADLVWSEFQRAWKNADVKLDWSLY